jgi:hypothetical protein
VGKLRDITGQRFGRLVAVRRVGKNGRGEHSWLCRCDCGREVVVRVSHAGGHTKSCGCLALEMSSRRSTTHGHTRGGCHTPEFETWASMRRRCRHPYRKYYHGRGIKVCARWERFENFLADMGPKPSPKHQIDRIDNDGDYTPENCRWVTAIEQQNNKRSSRFLTVDGETMTIAEWARTVNIHPHVIHDRLKRGWSLDWVLMPFPGMMFWEG